MNAFTIWTRRVLNDSLPWDQREPQILHCPSTEWGATFGIAYFSEIWFRFIGKYLFTHTGKGPIPDASAIMERRNS